MKKVLISVVLFIIAVLCVVNCFAKVNLTKDNLQNAYNEYAKPYEGSYTPINGGGGYADKKETPAVKVENDKLVYEETDAFGTKTGKTFNISYSLSGKPTFTFEKTITKDTTIEDMYEIGKDMESPIIGVVGSAIVQGMKPSTAGSYIDELKAEEKINKYTSHSIATIDGKTEITIGAGDTAKVFKKGEMDNFEYLDYAINDSAELSDENTSFYTYKFTKTKKSDTEYLLKSEIVVNLDANLSAFITEPEVTPTVNNTVNNTINNTVNNTVKNTVNTIKASVTSNKNNVTNNTVNVVNNTTNTAKSKIPFVGTDSTVVTKLIILLSLIALVNVLRLIRLEKKNDNR